MITVYIPVEVLNFLHCGERSQALSRLLVDHGVGALSFVLADALRRRFDSDAHKTPTIKTSLSLTPAAETILRAACDRYSLSPSLVITLLIEGSAIN
jgi:hypothetical protein